MKGKQTLAVLLKLIKDQPSHSVNDAENASSSYAYLQQRLEKHLLVNGFTIALHPKQIMQSQTGYFETTFFDQRGRWSSVTSRSRSRSLRGTSILTLLVRP